MPQFINILISSMTGAITGTMAALIAERYKGKHRYREPQIGIYLELWRSLNNLKSSADYLWEAVNRYNLSKFAKQLQETEQTINQNSLLIEDVHMQQLRKLMQAFWGFEIGKKKLITLRNKQGFYDGIIEGIARDTIEHNRQTKEQYDQLVDQIEISFKKQLKAP